MNDIIIYQNGEIELNVSIQDKSIWLTQKQIAKLFNIKIPAVKDDVLEYKQGIFYDGQTFLDRLVWVV